MASTYSTNLKIELQATGENSGTWGTITNTNLGTALEQAIVGYGNPSYASDANLTLTYTDTNAAQAARALVLNVTSAVSLTATRELVVPTIQKQYIVQNNTTGSQSITVKTSAGTGITVPNGRKAHLYVDGTNVIYMDDYVDINGGAIDGTPIGASSASTGAFTTLSASGNFTLSGGTANGVLYLNGSKVATSGSALVFDGTNLGIGTTSPNISGYGANSRILTIQGVSGSYAINELASNSANSDGTYVGRLDFSSRGQAAGYENIAAIASFLSGSTSTKFGSVLQFFTRADNAGSGSPVERMRLDSSGNLSLATGNLTFSSTAQRITGDFSNATIANRVMFQSSTTNATTFVGLIPNGTGTTSSINCFGVNDPTNASFVRLLQNGTSDSQIRSDITGTGSYVPMTFYTGGSERVRIDTSGNVGIGVTPSQKLDVAGTSRYTFNVANAYTLQTSINAAGSAFADDYKNALSHIWQTSGSERMRIDSSGNVGIGGTASADTKVQVLGTLPTSSNTSRVYSAQATIPSGSTTQASCFNTYIGTQAASFTLANLYHYSAESQTFGAGSAVTNQYGFHVTSSLTGATNNYGFYSNIASGTNRWNFYANGTADNYFAGNTGIGFAPTSSTRLRVRGSDTAFGSSAVYVENSATTALFSVRNDGSFYTGLAASSPYNLTTANAANAVLDANGYLYRSTSSLRYKTNIVNAAHGLADVLKLRSVTYNGINNGDTVFGGLIAEEVHDAGLTEFVAYDKEGRPDALHYGNMVALLVKAVQELKAELEALKAA